MADPGRCTPMYHRCHLQLCATGNLRTVVLSLLSHPLLTSSLTSPRTHRTPLSTAIAKVRPTPARDMQTPTLSLNDRLALRTRLPMLLTGQLQQLRTLLIVLADARVFRSSAQFARAGLAGGADGDVAVDAVGWDEG